MSSTSAWDTSDTWDDGQLWESSDVADSAWPGLTTLDQLKSAMSAYLTGADFTDQYDLFIRLFEASVSDDPDMRLRANEARTTLSLSAETVSLPTGFRGVKRLWIPTYDPLQWASLEEEAFQHNNVSARPEFYNISSNVMLLAPVPDTTYTARLVYYYQLIPLTAANPSNTMLARHPQLYLWGSLCHAEMFLRDDARVALFKTYYEEARQKVIAADRAAQTTYGPRTFGRPPPRYRE
jgi:hypothetical protein